MVVLGQGYASVSGGPLGAIEAVQHRHLARRCDSEYRADAAGSAIRCAVEVAIASLRHNPRVKGLEGVANFASEVVQDGIVLGMCGKRGGTEDEHQNHECGEPKALHGFHVNLLGAG